MGRIERKIYYGEGTLTCDTSRGLSVCSIVKLTNTSLTVEYADLRRAAIAFDPDVGYGVVRTVPIATYDARFLSVEVVGIHKKTGKLMASLSFFCTPNFEDALARVLRGEDLTKIYEK